MNITLDCRDQRQYLVNTESNMKILPGFRALLLISRLFQICFGDAYDSYSRLHSHILNKTMKYVRPRLNMSEIVDINVRIFLNNIENFDISSGTLSLSFTVHSTWRDDYKIWNSSDFDGISVTSIPKSTLWIPTMLIAEAVSFSTRYAMYNDGKDLPVEIYDNGIVSYLKDTKVDLKCNVNVWKYPFDKHMCTLSLLTSHYRHETRIAADHPMYVFTMMNNNSNWEISNLSYENTDVISLYSKVIFRMTLTRNPQYLLLNIISPVIILEFLNLFVFVLPIDSGERVSVSITILLTVFVFMTSLSDKLPETHSPYSSFNIFVVAQLMYSSLITISAIFMAWMHSVETVPSILTWCRKCSGKTGDNSDPDEKLDLPLPTWKDLSYKFNKVCLVLFSLCACIAVIHLFGNIAA